MKKKNEILFFDHNFIKQRIIKLPKTIFLDRCYYYNEIILARNNYTSKPIIINLNDNSIDYFEDFPFYLKLSDEISKLIVPIVSSKDIYSVPESGLYDFFNKNILWLNSNVRNINFYNGVLIGELNNTIYRYDVFDGNILWQKNLETDFPGQKISRLVGVYENVLIVGIATDWLIGLDTESGNILWKTKTSTGNHLIYDNKTSLLKTIISKYYFEIEVLSGNLKKIQFMDDDNMFDSQRTNFVIVEDHIITTDWKKGIIGAFNTVTHQFDWIHKEEGVSFPAGQPIKYFEPYLFVMDSKQTLHIFQKENPSI